MIGIGRGNLRHSNSYQYLKRENPLRGVNLKLIAGYNFMIIMDSFDNKGIDYCVCDDRCWPGLTAPTPTKYPKGRSSLTGVIKD